MNLSALIGWNILSSLSVVIWTNERIQIYNRSHGLYPSLWLNHTFKSHHNSHGIWIREVHNFKLLWPTLDKNCRIGSLFPNIC